MDQDEAVRVRVARNGWYALRWCGAGYLRQIRREGSAISVLGQGCFEASVLPPRIDVSENSLLHVVRARVIWMGGDPRSSDPFTQPEGWLPGLPAVS